MDATVNDFLKEINEIAPPLQDKIEDCAWEECFDKVTGFPYYWNISTNEVTWEMPKEYKIWIENTKCTKKPPKKSIVQEQKKLEPLIPKEALPSVPTNFKIYKIKDEPVRTDIRKVIPKPKEIKSLRPPRKNSSDSDNEKIVLISSYGGDTDSEDEIKAVALPKLENGNSSLKCEKSTNSSKSSSRKNSDSEDNDDDDEETILEKIQNKAKLLKALGGDIPTSVQNLVSNVDIEEKHIKKPSSGFSLVAGYGNDSDEEEELPGSPMVPERIAHSTLFPIPQTIDVNQFIDHKPIENPEEKSEEIDTKIFQRKRRIGINLVNIPKKPRETETLPSDKLGFRSINYPGFQSGGIAFLKSDILNPLTEKPVVHPGSLDSVNEIDDIQVTLKEKLAFLSEGRDLVSPVQVMIIQMETLYDALKAGCLTASYLNKWLKETCEELIKLEMDAAPNGWLLQWDRSQKRYYYKNQSTNECQWDYPKPAEDDAMDICTTPPPPPSDDTDEIIIHEPPPPPPPPPPKVNVSPPPPPIISEMGIKNSVEQTKPTTFTLEEPLPPGVDPEPRSIAKKNTEDLSSVLDSFYSDIAAMENTTPLVDTVTSTATIASIEFTEPVKKKRKVKMAQGLAMKKKGVSKLVEKWKNVQKNLD